MKKLSETVKVRVATTHKKVQGIISGYNKGDHFTLLDENAEELTTKDLPFDRDYTPAEWEAYKQTKAFITLMKDLDSATEGVSKDEHEIGDGDDKITIVTIRRMYPTIGGISLSALMSGAKAVASKKLEAPNGAVLLKGRDEEAILNDLLIQAEPFASEKGKVEIVILSTGQYKIKGVENPIKVVWWQFVDLSKKA